VRSLTPLMPMSIVASTKRAFDPPRATSPRMLKQCHEQIGAGVVDLSFQTPGSEDPGELMEALELFGKKVLPHIRDV
jgi:hypothetical protein